MKYIAAALLIIMSISAHAGQMFQVDYSVKGVVHDSEVKTFYTRHECRSYAHQKALEKGPQWRGSCYPHKERKAPKGKSRVEVESVAVQGGW